MYGNEGAVRTERIEARIEPDRAERIRYAADLAHTSLSAFVVDAASEKAERVIAEQKETVVPADFFDAWWSVVDKASPALRKGAAKAKRSVRAR